ncbi:MAG: SDR family oxidoreductase [Pseudomonadota bacterium]
MPEQYADFSLAGKTALITGAGSGLGASFADVLAGAGARLILAARRADKLEATRERVVAAGGEAICVPMDVTAVQSVEDAFNEIEQLGWRADVLINNAGVSREQFIGKFTEADWDAIVDTNLKGVFLVAQQFGNRLIEAGHPGAVVNIASVLGHRSSRTLSAYCASKAGVLSLTESMANEWARFGIRVNAISPGFYRTEINEHYLDSPQAQQLIHVIPQKRIGENRDLAGPLLLLASDAGRYMTGSNITVDGGLLLGGLG